MFVRALLHRRYWSLPLKLSTESIFTYENWCPRRKGVIDASKLRYEWSQRYFTPVKMYLSTNTENGMRWATLQKFLETTVNDAFMDETNQTVNNKVFLWDPCYCHVLWLWFINIRAPKTHWKATAGIYNSWNYGNRTKPYFLQPSGKHR